MELGTSHKTEHARNGELTIAAKVRWVEMGPTVSHKTDPARNGDFRNVACPRQAETDLLASHKMERTIYSAVHCTC